MATVRPNLKNFAMVDRPDIIVSTGFAVLGYKKMELKFLYNFLYSHYAEKQCFALTMGSNYPALNSNDVKKLKLPIPPLEEQKSIANCLSTWDSGIERLTQLIQAKKQQKKGLMQRLFSGELSMINGQLEKVENKGNRVKGWREMRLRDILKKIVGGGTPSRNNAKYWEGDIPWATVKDFTSFNEYRTEEFITEEGLKNSFSNLIPKGTLITSTRMGLGKVSLYRVDVAINQDLKAL